MVNYREILRINSLKYTQRQIAASVHSSRNTISEVVHPTEEAIIKEHDIPFPKFWGW